MLPRSLHVFSPLGVFLISVKPLTSEITENKTTPKFCKIAVSKLQILHHRYLHPLPLSWPSHITWWLWPPWLITLWYLSMSEHTHAWSIVKIFSDPSVSKCKSINFLLVNSKMNSNWQRFSLSSANLYSTRCDSIGLAWSMIVTRMQTC